MTFFAILPNHWLAKDEEDDTFSKVSGGSPKDEMVINIDVREPVASDKPRINGFFTRLVELLGVLQLIMKGGEGGIYPLIKIKRFEEGRKKKSSVNHVRYFDWHFAGCKTNETCHQLILSYCKYLKSGSRLNLQILWTKTVKIHWLLLPKFFDLTCKVNIVSLVKTNDWLSLAIGWVYLMDTLSKQTMCSCLTGHLLNDSDENDNNI